jgi:hypothetical protein
MNNTGGSTIRFLSIDAIQKANSGHPGMPMGAAPLALSFGTAFLNTTRQTPAGSTVIALFFPPVMPQCSSTGMPLNHPLHVVRD